MRDIDQQTLHVTETTNIAPGAWSSAALFIAGLTALLIAASEFSHPQPMALPLLSAALVIAGFASAAWSSMTRGTGEAMGDRMVVPGLLLFFGFAAAMMSDLDSVVQHLTLLR